MFHKGRACNSKQNTVQHKYRVLIGQTRQFPINIILIMAGPINMILATKVAFDTFLGRFVVTKTFYELDNSGETFEDPFICIHLISCHSGVFLPFIPSYQS